MDHIVVNTKKFVPFIHEKEIQTAIQKMAEQINQDYQEKGPIFVAVLNGVFMFASDLLKQITIPCDISFVKHSSYKGLESSGEVKQMIGLEESIYGRNVILLEDIVDTGTTIKALVQELSFQQPRSIKIATLLCKKEAYTLDIPIDYVCLEVPNKFLIGYGLDYNGKARNLKEIYQLHE